MNRIALLLAVAKTVATEIKSLGNLPAGEYSVDGSATFDLSACVVKSEDEQYRPTTHIPLIPTLVLFSRYAGITRGAALTHLRQAMTDCLNNPELDKAGLLSVSDVDGIMAEIVADTLNAMPEKTRTGKTKINELNVDISVELPIDTPVVV